MNQKRGRIWPFFLLLIVLAGISGCAASAPDGKKSAPSVMSVAVWDLENFSGGPESDWGEVLSSSVIQVFEESGRYTVVEREQLILALEELHVGSSALADERTRLKVGKIVGARFMVFGGYFVLESQMRLDLRLVEVESGRIVRAAQKTIPAFSLVEGMDAAKAAAREIL